MFFLEHYLDHRQHFLFKTVKEIPVDLKGHVSEVEFTKSQTYNSDKSAFGLFESSITFFEGVALLSYFAPVHFIMPKLSLINKESTNIISYASH